MCTVMADYGIPAGDKIVTIRGTHSRRCLGNTTRMLNASLIRLRSQFEVVLVGGNIWRRRNAQSASSWERSHHTTDGNVRLRLESSSLASVRTSMVPS